MTIHWNRKSYTEEQFRAAWAEANSINDVARRLGLRVSGGASTTLRVLGETLGLNNSHFMRTVTRPYSLEEILVENTPLADSGRLGKRLVREGVKEDKCENCGITEWMGQPAPLQLDHINGNNRDNRLENLRILCMNCHGLTPTWGGKDRIRRTSNGLMPGESQAYCECGNKMWRTSATCQKCRVRVGNGGGKEKDIYPATADIIAGVETMGYLAYGRTINLSDNGVRKLLTRRGVNPLPAAKNRKVSVVEKKVG